MRGKAMDILSVVMKLTNCKKIVKGQQSTTEVINRKVYIGSMQSHHIDLQPIWFQVSRVFLYPLLCWHL